MKKIVAVISIAIILTIMLTPLAKMAGESPTWGEAILGALTTVGIIFVALAGFALIIKILEWAID